MPIGILQDPRRDSVPVRSWRLHRRRIRAAAVPLSAAAAPPSGGRAVCQRF